MAVAVVRDDEVVTRGFGVRDVDTGAPVTPETMFHLASVSKPFVATAVVALATARNDTAAALDLDAPIVEWVPEFTLADGRAREVTARGLLSHTSGLPDVADYGWHDPQLDDDALSEFARSLSGWRLRSEPGSAFSYSNAGFELLGLLLSRVTGTTFEDGDATAGPRPTRDARQHVPAQRGARSPGGLTARGDAAGGARGRLPVHPAPCPQLDPALQPGRDVPMADGPPRADRGGCRGSEEQWARLDPELVDRMRQPVVQVGEPPWDESAALGWAVGTYRGHRTFGHSGFDPGFGSRLVVVPSRRTGVVVLANSNTVPASLITKAALDLALADDPRGEGASELRGVLPSVVEPLAETLTNVGTRGRSGGVPPPGLGRTGGVRPRRRRVRGRGVGSDRAASHEHGLAAPATVDRRASGLVDGLDDDRMGPSGGRAAGPGQESSPARPRPRPREPRRRADHEQH